MKKRTEASDKQENNQPAAKPKAKKRTITVGKARPRIVYFHSFIMVKNLLVVHPLRMEWATIVPQKLMQMELS